ncbi:MAG: hypothetical protein L0Z68_07050 [Gammaproteobacteria bacterium]|nr:hypothetical protein [Gammaproteobacteria bacterium]
MKGLISLLKVFGYVWGTLAIFLVLFAVVGIWATEGYAEVQAAFSPSNVLTWVVVLLIVLPTFAAFRVLERLEKKSKRQIRRTWRR